jgi:hypothetical protein
MEIREAIREYAGQPITRQVLFGLLHDYKRPYDKIAELLKQGLLSSLKGGLYVAGPKIEAHKPEPFLVANHLWGPSYVSLESALSYWGLIPEKVFETSSVTTQKSKTYNTPMGRFSYLHLPLPYYSFGIQQLALTKQQRVLVASAEKALCDKIILTAGLLLRSTKQTTVLLQDDMRMEKEKLQNLNTEEMSKWIKVAPKKNSLAMVIKTLEQL